MSNDWRKYTLEDDEYEKMMKEDDDPREVLKEEFEFLRNNWFTYLTAAALSFVLVAVVITAFLTVASIIANGF